MHIPYRGSAPSLAALIAGEVDLSFANIPAIHAHVKSGRLRALAVAAAKRDPQLPEVPTMKQHPEEFSRLMREELARWAEVVKVSGARAE